MHIVYMVQVVLVAGQRCMAACGRLTRFAFLCSWPRARPKFHDQCDQWPVRYVCSAAVIHGYAAHNNEQRAHAVLHS